MTRPPDLKSLSSSEKDALIGALPARIDGLAARVEQLEARVAALAAENAALKAENAALREKLTLPPKTPDNSSKPPSQGPKRQGERKAKPKGKVHAGAHRPLHPNPTRRRDVFVDRCPHCQAAVAAAPQLPLQAYDRIEIPAITPDVTRVTLFGGICPCCQGRFKATPPADLPPGSPFGPNLRAFVVYLRFAQAIPFERLARLLFELFGLTVRRRLGQHAASQRAVLRGASRHHPPAPVVRHGPAVRRDLGAGRQPDLVDLGVPPRRQRLLCHRPMPRQEGGRGLPRRGSS